MHITYNTAVLLGRLNLAVLLFGLTILFGLQASVHATEQRAIFRHITVVKGEKIVLGQPITNAVRAFLISVGSDRYLMRKGTFVRAEAITIELAPNGHVRAIFFEYAPATDYAAIVASYRGSLGEPVRQGERSDDGDVVTRWEDPYTVFELVHRGSVVRSSLYDRNLSNQ